MISAILVASGSSRRMGFDKLLAPLGSKNVLALSIEALLAVPEVGELICVTEPERFEVVESLVANSSKPIRSVPGGTERQDSVWSGLQAVSPESELVAIHDGARPLVCAETISKCLAIAKKKGAASLAHPVTETLKRANEKGLVCESVSRDHLWAMETPQCFQLPLILQAYNALREDSGIATDEVSAVQSLGASIHLVHNHKPNPKITYPGDLALAENLLQARVSSAEEP